MSRHARPLTPTDRYAVSNGTLKNTHQRTQCAGQFCCLHNPSDHTMRDWPMFWREDRYLMERTCPHGIGHPDPDDLAFKARVAGNRFALTESVHGCDGCCFQ